MTTILRVTGTTSFPLASGTIDFTDAEVDDVLPLEFIPQVLSESQQRSLTIYDDGSDFWTFDVTFVIENYNTLLKLSELRKHRGPMILYHSFRHNPTHAVEVLLTNPNEFREILKRGYQVLGYSFTLNFREPLGETCSPPSGDEYGNIGAS